MKTNSQQPQGIREITLNNGVSIEIREDLLPTTEEELASRERSLAAIAAAILRKRMSPPQTQRETHPDQNKL